MTIHQLVVAFAEPSFLLATAPRRPDRILDHLFDTASVASPFNVPKAWLKKRKGVGNHASLGLHRLDRNCSTLLGSDLFDSLRQSSPILPARSTIFIDVSPFWLPNNGEATKINKCDQRKIVIRFKRWHTFPCQRTTARA